MKRNNQWTIVAIIGLALLSVCMLIFAPLATIWAFNTLFNLSIPFVFKTWLAVLVLVFMFSGYGYKYKK